jgi:hypothetical protein
MERRRSGHGSGDQTLNFDPASPLACLPPLTPLEFGEGHARSDKAPSTSFLFPLASTVKFAATTGFVAAFSLVGALAWQPSAQAACLPTNPSNICNTFDFKTVSNVVDRGGYAGTFTGVNYTQVRVAFRLIGAWNVSPPITISGIKLFGQGIGPGGFSFGDVSASTLGDSNALQNPTAFVNLTSPILPGQTLDFSSALVSFNIPANVASAGSQLRAVIQYADASGDQFNTSVTSFLTTAVVATPAPLPLLGAGAAFAFSRRLRRRIRRAS